MSLTTLQRVKQVLVKRLGVKEFEIEDETMSWEDMGLDHFDEVDVLLGLEDEFSVSISDDDWDGKVHNLKEAVECVERLV
jgi:acyl carrier protein